jgi:hypothetical protein
MEKSRIRDPESGKISRILNTGLLVRYLKSWFRICDILVWIWIRGSVPPFFISGLQGANKKYRIRIREAQNLRIRIRSTAKKTGSLLLSYYTPTCTLYMPCT